MTQIGYMAVVVPELDFYQGYFIDDRVADLTEVILAAPLPPGIEREGVLSAALAECALCMAGLASTISMAEARLGILAYALYQLTDERYFWIYARRDKGGLWTQLTPIDVPSIPTAREWIECLLEVRQIKARLLQNLLVMPSMKKH